MIGRPGKPSAEFQKGLEEVQAKLRDALPSLEVAVRNEDFTSQRAAEMLRTMGVKKSARKKKEVLDSASAVIILQEYLESDMDLSGSK